MRMNSFEFENYEILSGYSPHAYEGICEGYPPAEAVHYIQNAGVKVDNIDLKYKIHWKDGKIDSNVEMLSILIENKDHKLGDIFVNSPYGIIKKNRTGIGATTLELNSKRNSIIVVPTKALAYNKALSYFEINGFWSVLYVGSDVDGAPNNLPDIEEYLNDETIVHKKFIVVADSLYKVIDAIGDEVKDSYFLMVDEIDSFQSDSTYRPRLESVIDYYLDFNSSKRCLVSATLNEFSNPRIATEPIINIIYKDPIHKNIDLIHTNNHNAVAVAEIKKHYALSTNKIVVAYNKIQFIRQIIAELGEEYKDDCQILCSIASKGNAKGYYAELNGRSLSKRITFITCTYFVGIDIDDRFHLISISNNKHPYTLLSHDRLIQIAGRCRDVAGLYSETIIFDTIEYDFPKTPEQIKVDTLALAGDLKTYVDSLDKIANKYPDIISSGFIAAKDAIIEKATFEFSKSDSIPILRKNIFCEYVPAYFNIDAIYEFYKLRTELYSNRNQLLSILSNGNQVKRMSVMIDISDEQKAIALSDAEDMASTQEVELEELIAVLSEKYEADTLNNRSLREIKKMYKTSRYCMKFIERFESLYDYIPFYQLIEKLITKNNLNKKGFRGFNNAAVFWALDNNHPFKSQIMNEFQAGNQFVRNELAFIFSEIVSYHLQINLGRNQSIEFINQICKLTPGNSINGSISTFNKFNPYNPQNFEHEPLKLIPRNANLTEFFKFGER